MAVFHQPQTVGDHRQQVHIVADQDHGAGIGGQGLDQCFAAFDIKVVCRLVQNQQMRRGQGGQQQRQPRLLPAGQTPDLGFRLIGAKAETGQTGAQTRFALVRTFTAQVLDRGFVDEQFVHLMLGEKADPQLARGLHIARHRLKSVR